MTPHRHVHRILTHVLLWGAAGMLLGARAPACASEICPTVVDGLDPAIWNSSASPFFGRALGQTFLARDTLITRLTLWRPAPNLSVVGAHLFITTVDTTRTPPRPLTQDILLDGPTLRVYASSPPGQLIEMPFVIDPPLALPRPGLYAFFLQAEDCNPGSVWSFITNNLDPYPDGMAWITNRAVFLDTCFLARSDGYIANEDYVFQLEYQRPETPLDVSLVSSQADPCSVRVAWSAGGLGGLLTTLYRRTPDRDWSSLGSLVADSTGRLTYVDRQVVRGGRYGYRLGVKNNCGPEALLGETWADIPASARMVLDSARAEPCAEHCKVELAWTNVGGPADLVTVWRRAANEDWSPLATITGDDSGRFRYEDTQVSPGLRYGYRLGVRGCVRDEFFPETWVEVPAADLALSSVRPNPAGDTFTVALALRDGSPARLELLDLAGRRVLVRDVGSLGRGDHLVQLPEARSLRAGVYLVRLTQGGRSLTTRVALIR